jgi:N-acetylglucosamine-6-phosphate deacetylase
METEDVPVFVDNTQPQPRYNLRGKRINYDHRYDHQFTQVTAILPKKPQTNPVIDLQNHILVAGLIFNQMGGKKGIKLHGDKAIDAIVQEFKQLDHKATFKPRQMMGLTDKQ